MEEDPEHDPPSGTYYHTTERTYLLQFEWGTLELGMSSDGSAWAEAISNQGERLVMNTYSAHKYARTRNQSAVVQQTIIIRQVCNALRLACGALQICVNEWNAYREAVTYTDKFGSPEALRNLEDKFAEVLRTYRALERCARAKFHCTAALGACDVFGY